MEGTTYSEIHNPPTQSLLCCVHSAQRCQKKLGHDILLSVVFSLFVYNAMQFTSVSHTVRRVYTTETNYIAVYVGQPYT